LGVNLDGRPARAQFTLTIRPEKIQVLGASESSAGNCFKATIREVTYNGAATEYLLEIAGQLLKASLANTQIGQRSWNVRQTVSVHLPSEALIVLDD